MTCWDNELKPSGQMYSPRNGAVERDVITLAVTLSAIAMFVGTGGATIPKIVNSMAGTGIGPDRLLSSALLLNIALIIFGWRRYNDLNIEVRERRKAENHARRLADTDPLTGCLNRRSIAYQTDMLVGAAPARGEAVAFLMIDLDNFKQINDLKGHSVGDSILQESARRIGALLPERALIARIGGDEFACVVPFDAHRPDRIDHLAGAIIDAVARPVEIAEFTVDATVSLGLARSDFTRGIDNSGSPSQMLMHMADVAMYNSKKNGRNRYFWFESTMESELRFRRELETGIRFGIPRGEFVPFYEQQIDLESGELVGFEMLARWNSPTLGIVSPEIFIPIAEEIGVIADLSECVIKQALKDASEWDSRLTLSVNISPIQLRDPWFAQKLLKILVEANFPPSRLDIEITESCLHENIGVVRTLVTSLRNQGIRVSLDDFGTGYSSLAQLRSLPFDRIKIDRSFVSNISENQDSATIVKAITSLGQGLGLPITAEGIETEDVLENLKQLGKFKGQGYFYGRPESAESTLKRLADLNLLRQEDGRLSLAQATKTEIQPEASEKSGTGSA